MARCSRALSFVDRGEGVLIGVERHLGVDHQRTAARHADDRVGAHPPILGLHRHFEREIGMLGKPAGFEHVAQLLLAPAAARLGRGAQRVDELGRLAAHRFLPVAHRADQAGQVAIGLGALLLDAGDALLIALERGLDRLEQRLQPLARFLVGLGETLVGALEESLLRLAEQLAADLAELRRSAPPWPHAAR